jgi:pyruvate formate lyase activating enzyme
MKITRFLRESYSDYPGKVASVVFTQACNYKCPSCHAKQILNSDYSVSQEQVLQYLNPRKGFVNAVVLCGGEPILQPDIKNFVKQIKDLGFFVKLDTNGSHPEILQDLLKENLVDYAAMDIKGPPYLYKQLAGSPININNLKKAISIVAKFPDYEFRTTICPLIRQDKISFISKSGFNTPQLAVSDLERLKLPVAKGKKICGKYSVACCGDSKFLGNFFISPEEAVDAAKMIVQATGNNTHKYFLQKFVSRSQEEMIDERFAKENLPLELQETPKPHLEAILKAVSVHLPNTKIR